MYRHQILELELNFFFSLKNPDFQGAASPSSTPLPIHSVPCSASAASPTIVEQVTVCKQWSSKRALNNCWNTNISFYLETSCGQNSTLYLNIVHFFNTSVNKTSVVAQDSCFPAQVSNMHCSIVGISKLLIHRAIWWINF